MSFGSYMACTADAKASREIGERIWVWRVGDEFVWTVTGDAPEGGTHVGDWTIQDPAHPSRSQWA